jgi:hypothetical protein
VTVSIVSRDDSQRDGTVRYRLASAFVTRFTSSSSPFLVLSSLGLGSTILWRPSLGDRGILLYYGLLGAWKSALK